MAYNQWNGGGYPGRDNYNGYGGPPGGYNSNGYGPPPQPPRPQQQWQGPGYGHHQYHQQGGSSYQTPPPQYQQPQPVYAPYSNPQLPPRPSSSSYGQAGRAAPVPHAPQQFGQGAPSGYTFQYSNCTGQRKALLIGINYLGQNNALRGCINDVHNVSAFLMRRYNYKLEDMVILTDDQRDPVRQPTKANIRRAMGWLVQGARPNDSLFLHFSGHGGQTKDLDGDEDDGYDEVIYPVDYRTAGHLVDDEIHALVVKPLVPGVRLTAIFDSCHSGTAMDLPYVYSTKGVLKEPNLASEAGQGALQAFSSYARGDIAGVISSVMGLANKAMRGNDGYYRTIQTKTSPADVIMFSGSKDNQTSADATIAQQATGAMSWAFITALERNPRQQSYVELLNNIRDVLSTRYTQKPQLSCSHPLDTNILFVM